MKVKDILLLIAVLCMFDSMWAFDFSALSPSGHRVYYKVVEGGVSVVFPAADRVPVYGWVGYTRPTGDLVLASSVIQGDTVYRVISVGNHAFYGCVDLTSVVLPEGIRTLGSNAFNGCQRLHEATLPATLDSVGPSAFLGCTALRELRMMGCRPPECYTSAYTGLTMDSLRLNVPCGCVTGYRAAAPWSMCGVITDSACGLSVVASANYPRRGSVSGSGVYPVGAMVSLSATPADGCFFACWSNGDTLNPLLLTVNEEVHLVAHFFPMQHDTVRLTDTVRVADTVHPPLCRLSVRSAEESRGRVAGNAWVPTGTVIEVAALPEQGYEFSLWSDGRHENPRRVQLDRDSTLTAYFTPLAGIDLTSSEGWEVTTSHYEVHVRCSSGMEVAVFDAMGRKVCAGVADEGRVSLKVPAAGLYVVQLGGISGRRVVVSGT